MDSQSAREALTAILSSPGLVNEAAKHIYLEDGGENLSWGKLGAGLQDIYRGEVRQVLSALLEVLPEGRRTLQAA